MTAPAAPTITGITPGNTSLSVAFTAGADGGSAITNYKYSTDNGSTFTPVSPAATTSPILISGLTNGTTYQVQILAVNAVGDGAASSTVSGTPAGGSVYASWAASYSLTGGNAAQTADPDGDGQNNLLEFATNDNPNSGSASGKQKAAVAAVGGQQVFTLTLPVRAGATFSGSFDLASATIDGIIYTIQGTIDLVAGFTNTVVPVSEVTGNDATTIQTGLPALETAWTYRTFRADGYTVSSNPYLFLRLKVTASP